MKFGNKNVYPYKFGTKDIFSTYWEDKKVWELGNAEDYCTIEALEDGLTISFSNTIKYSTNCKIWKTLEANTISKEFKSGQKLYFKANLTPTSEYGIGTFSVSKNFKLYGNVMSLLFSNDGKDNDDLTGYNYAFKRLFQGCATLQEVSNDFLSKIKVLSEGCYEEMFSGCTSLTNAPELPIVTLTRYCYLGMFDGCSSLELASELPATELVESCYERMFKGCTSLKSVLSLPATILVENCYRNMFYNCSNLNFIEALFITPPLEEYTKDWVYGVYPQGVFVKNDNATWLINEHRNPDGIPEGWNVYNKSESDIIINNYLIIESLEDNLFVQFTYDCQYSLDGFNWLDLSSMRRTIAINEGRRLYFKADNLIPNDVDGIGQFTISGKCNLLGNCNSMLFGDNAKNNNDISGYPYAFKNLFAYNDIIEVSPLFLPATKLAKHCYENMFYKCSSLLKSPILLATERASYCYYNMFAYTNAVPDTTQIDFSVLYGLEGLFAYTNVTDSDLTNLLPINSDTNHYWLPAMELQHNYCYDSMFRGCTLLTTAPELPATTLTASCYYYMFAECTSLQTIPELPATTLKSSSYAYMFEGCTSLVNIGEQLPATTLAIKCYDHMFAYCTSLNNIPENYLPATELMNDCYNQMFRGCTGLINLPYNLLPATTLAPYCYYAMFQECTGLQRADIVLPATKVYAYSYGSMFYGCTELQSMPDLPATELDTYCYYQMCYDCRKLTEVPKKLPAEKLYTSCYNNMFNACLSLENAPDIQANELATNSCSHMFYNCKNLITTQERLYATTLKENCYYSMFNACSSLVTAPELPATNLSISCYEAMFKGCASLTNAPELPADHLYSQCYRSMFEGCSKLTTAPELPAYLLAGQCYERMFYGCSKLEEITVGFLNEPNESYTLNWVYGVAKSGTFIKTSNQSWETKGVNAIPDGWEIINEESSNNNLNESNYLVITASEDLNIKFTNDCKYSFDAKEWHDLNNTNGINLSKGDSIYLKGNLVPTENGIGNFIISNKCSLYGNCNSLIDYNPLSDYTYKGLFEGQPIVNVSLDFLPSTELSKGCYEGMFKNCVHLKNAPELPATTLAENCYKEMFYGCSSLKLAPELCSTQLVSNCYNQMFYECSNLQYICALFETSPNESYTSNWTYGVAVDNGVFITNDNIDWENRGTNGIPEGWNIREYKDANKYLTIKSRENNNTINFTNNCQYSIDTIEWNDFDTTNGYVLQCGEFIYFKSTNAYVENVGVGTFSSTGKFNLYGNCNSMLFGDDAYNNNTELKPYAYSNLFNECKVVHVSKDFLPSTKLKNYCYQYMFNRCISLVTPPELPATALNSYCYYYMFNYCVSMVESPVLPAKTLTHSCYYGMFANCISLKVVSDLPATTIYNQSYFHMFENCLSLETAPNLDAQTVSSAAMGHMFRLCTKLKNIEGIKLSAKTVYHSSYAYMFYRCRSLETTPELPATTLAPDCYYYIFGDCTALQQAPEELPGDKLFNNCYGYMFYKCTSLVKAPKIKATQNSGAYNSTYRMFYGCTSLKEVEDIYIEDWGSSSCYQMFCDCTSLVKAPNLYATTIGKSSYYAMFQGCTSLVIPPDLPATTLNTNSYEYMFNRCTSLKIAPALPAKELNTLCYNHMFYNCDSLIAAPELPATTLTSNCYQSMFYSCNNLKFINTNFTTPPSTDYTSAWMTECNNNGYFIKSNDLNENDIVRNGSGVLTNWIIKNKSEYNSYIKDYLTIEALERELEVQFTNNCQYSFDGFDWYDLPANTLTPAIGKGRKIYFKSNLQPTEDGIGKFTVTKKFNLLGNCNSMIGNDLGLIFDNLTSYPNTYKGLFENQPVVNIENNFLPSTILSEGCYEGMFKNCQYLETSPVLPSENLVSNCYKEMFYGCSSLETIKALFTTPSSELYMENWVYGVSNQGVFEISPEIEWNVEDYRGVSGIPENWNIV